MLGCCLNGACSAFVITPKDPAPVKTASVASPVRILTPVKSPAASRPMSPVRGESPDRDEGGEDGQEGEETGDRRGGRSGKVS